MTHNDLTFFTNEPERNLYDRFQKILSKNTKFFDALVGYFRTSGFFLLHPALEEVEKIRILVGLNVDPKTVQIIERAGEEQLSFEMSSKHVKDNFKENVIEDLEHSEDSYRVEKGIRTFIKWLVSGKIEMRIYPHSPIHAKLYIMRKDLDKVPDQFGSIITGSSNFSQAGLVNNLEFNVELKDSRDVHFALERFEELWENSVEITSEYIETLNEKTWIRDNITPYELFLKTLYEYFKEEINEDKNDQWNDMLPDGFMKLQYQVDAVVQAKKTLDAYGGVFISDVVGLGKTYICAMLAQQLKGKKLIICPPVLKEYWERVLFEFEVRGFKVESLGKLDQLLEAGTDQFSYVFIDEAHRFRNQITTNFQKLHEICFGKKVILITATPQNNYSTDIANQIYLFQPKNNSTIIPNNKNIERFFNKLESNLRKCEKGSYEYIETIRKNSEVIRDKVLRNVMIRRTRNEIKEFYGDDMKQQGLEFPHLDSPDKIVYLYKGHVEKVFNETINVIQRLDYARYKPLTYLEIMDNNVKSMLTSQKNMSGFMKSILVKRLESSFEAFKKTLNRFIDSYRKFIKMCLEGKVYISKKVDVYDLLDSGDDERLMELVEEDKVQYYNIDNFNEYFLPALKRDLLLLETLSDQWEEIIEDPKKNQFLFELANNEKLKNKKIIIFTESKETAEYVGSFLEDKYPDEVIVFSGKGSRSQRMEIEANYNPNYQGTKRDDIRFLVTTDVLAEGINLHRSNVLINYDLPWNPTKVMQRVGRINRVGTEHNHIYVFNFFPAAQTNAHLPLEQNIISKIQAFHDTLGEDFKYLSEAEEVSSHNLYHKLTSKESLEFEEDQIQSELLYLGIIRDVRDQNPDLFAKIKKLPKKAKTAKTCRGIEENLTLSFLRKGSLKKFFITDGENSIEQTFIEAMHYLISDPNERKLALKKQYFDHLRQNKTTFEECFEEEEQIDIETKAKSGNDSKVLKFVKALSNINILTDDQEEKLKRLNEQLEEGNLPASITKDIIKNIKGLKEPLKIYYGIINEVPEKYLVTKRELRNLHNKSSKTEIILSAYLRKEEKNV
ncbi:helicase-related protein [Pseudobacillus badius]|uniref:helicase-related protein n=1 Tax=Bacillus badius TaxID=1455 RepID=UPI0024A4905A|nr:helicase-related protein [Bacillus badius]GLY11442.1 ATP-dependent helicase [Bacillus badius]